MAFAGGGDIAQIRNTVEVAARQGRAFITEIFEQSPGGGGQNVVVRVLNPVDSGRNLLVCEVIYNASASRQTLWEVGNIKAAGAAALANALVARNLNPGSTEVAVATPSWQTNTPTPFDITGGFYALSNRIPANNPFRFSSLQDFSVLVVEGNGFDVGFEGADLVVGDKLTVEVVWTEEDV
jgi:hypothetical protein